jgi:protein TIF31
MFKCYMQGVDMMNLSSAISHFLNCFLGSYPSPHAQVNAEEVSGG